MISQNINLDFQYLIKLSNKSCKKSKAAPAGEVQAHRKEEAMGSDMDDFAVSSSGGFHDGFAHSGVRMDGLY